MRKNGYAHETYEETIYTLYCNIHNLEKLK